MFVRWLLAGAVVVAVGSCGSKPLSPEEKLIKLVEEGWKRYASGDYATAETRFREAAQTDASSAEVQLGLGWTHLRQNRLTDAVNALAKVTSSPVDRFAHAQAGLALVYDAQVKFDRSISAAEAVLARLPDYTFPHDGRVNWRDMSYLLAKNYLVLSPQADPNLTNALRHLGRIDTEPEIAPGNPDTWTADGQSYPTPGAALLKRLESLSGAIIDRAL